MTAQVTAPQTRAPIPDLDQLKLEPMAGDHDLDSFGTIEKFKALIPTMKLLPDDKFYVEIAGEPGTPEGGKSKSVTLPLGPTNPRSLNLEKKVVAFLLGKKMTVTYTIIRDGEDDKTSEPPLVLNVLPLPQSELKAARILEAQNNGEGDELDLTNSNSDRTLRLENWPLIAEKQLCWISLDGKKVGDVDHPLTVLQSEPVDGAWITRGYREVKVPYDYFRALLNGSPLKVIVKVALNQEDDETQAFDFEERVYTVKNVEVVKPVITKVTDSNDNPVVDNGETTDTTLKLEGTAGVGVTVEIFVGDDLKDTVTAVDGAWTYELTGLNPDTHVIKAIASGEDSNTWTVTVKAVAGQPWIRSATDVDGNDVRYASYTASTTVEVSGEASPHQEVSISDNYGFEDTATADDKGVWKKQLTGLKERLYIIKVAGSNNTHDRRFIVVDPRVTIITVARDSSGNFIPWNGTTRDRSVVLAGTGAAGEAIEIRNRNAVLGNPGVKPDGRWEFPVNGLTSDIHDFRALGSYSGGLVPHSYHFRVI
ncbi:hypothetical protein BK659_03495 [Pseudomonas brassicacearum]|uniref:Bacterial Ig-like domain-containing protein n=1 Tax=Pseudomonas brassicacearum TaxID=930166 RepID=A0A423HBY4_9PSED|nr:hypothetical protein [Pseudomonas brassicacearum]RON10587.1 hypothetical protein BK659_03495 [Pseudomonas brassicacearum]